MFADRNVLLLLSGRKKQTELVFSLPSCSSCFFITQKKSQLFVPGNMWCDVYKVTKVAELKIQFTLRPEEPELAKAKESRCNHPKNLNLERIAHPASSGFPPASHFRPSKRTGIQLKSAFWKVYILFPFFHSTKFNTLELDSSSLWVLFFVLFWRTPLCCGNEEDGEGFPAFFCLV